MMGFLTWAIAALLLLNCVVALDLPEFYLPPPEELNITNTNFSWGYNAWMPEYNWQDPNIDPTKPTFVMLSVSCILFEEELGSSLLQPMTTSWWKTCRELGIQCQCRPIVRYNYWNVEPKPEASITQGIHRCSWETRRVLDEHRRGLINLAGVSTRCSMRNPEIYAEARELGVPVFVTGMNPPRPGQAEYGMPEPDGFIGYDEEFYGRTMAKLLKQLLPQGGTYGFVMQWNGDTNNRNRDGFNEEMIPKLSDDDDVTVWKEVDTYPYEHPYNNSVPCNHLTCQMEGLVNNRTVHALIFLFESPINNPLYQEWVDDNRWRNLTLISKGSSERALEFLNTGYLDGLLSPIYHEYGVQSAKMLFATASKLASGELTLPLELKQNFFETRTLAHTVIPTNLDVSHPPQLDQNLLGNLSHVGFIGFGLVVATALACGIWTYLHRTKVVVRSAQPFFLGILAIGIVIFAATVIPLSFDDGGDPDSVSETFAVGVCMSQPWLAFSGFAIIFSALFSKTWRVNRLFHTQKHHSRVQVSRQDVLGPFAVIFTCNVLVLILWTAIDPLMYKRFVGDGTDLWNREIESYGACRSDKALAFLVPLACINFMVLGTACWQAFEARNIQSAFSESKYIALSVASLFQAFLTGFPILVIVKDEPKAFYLVLTLMILVLSEGILLLIFLPKIYSERKFSKMSEQEQRQMLAEQINKSTRSSDIRPTSIAQGSKFFRERASVKNAIRQIPETDQAVADGRGPSELSSTNGTDIASAMKDVRATSEAVLSGVTDPSTKDISSEINTFPREECSPTEAPQAVSLPPFSEQTVHA